MYTIKSLIYKLKDRYRDDKYSEKGIVNFFTMWTLSIALLLIKKQIKIDSKRIIEINRLWRSYKISKIEKDTERELFFKRKLFESISENSYYIEDALSLLEREEASDNIDEGIYFVKKVRGCLGFELNE